jgi:hypothetical protein
MEERARQYDQQDGERSVPAVVDAFNAIKGGDRLLTHADGWLFLVLLKLVRAQTAKGKAAFDSVEDAVAYAALFGEELLRANEPHQVGAIMGASGLGQSVAAQNAEAPKNGQARAALDAMPTALAPKPNRCTWAHKRTECFSGVPCDCDPTGQR